MDRVGVRRHQRFEAGVGTSIVTDVGLAAAKAAADPENFFGDIGGAVAGGIAEGIGEAMAGAIAEGVAEGAAEGGLEALGLLEDLSDLKDDVMAVKAEVDDAMDKVDKAKQIYKQVKHVVTPDPARPKFCTTCGAPNPGKFCTSCGSPQPGEAGPSATATQDMDHAHSGVPQMAPTSVNQIDGDGDDSDDDDWQLRQARSQWMMARTPMRRASRRAKRSSIAQRRVRLERLAITVLSSTGSVRWTWSRRSKTIRRLSLRSLPAARVRLRSLSTIQRATHMTEASCVSRTPSPCRALRSKESCLRKMKIAHAARCRV